MLRCNKIAIIKRTFGDSKELPYVYNMKLFIVKYAVVGSMMVIVSVGFIDSSLILRKEKKTTFSGERLFTNNENK